MIERIMLILKTQDLSSSQFADEIGVQRSSISHILSGRNNPSLEFVTKILKRFPDLQSDWLIFGKGPMYKDSSISFDNKLESSSFNKEPDLFDLPIEDNIPEIKIQAEIEETFIENKIEENISANTELKKEQTEKENIYDMYKEVETAFTEPKITENKEEIKTVSDNKKTVEKIAIFYSDRTFREYLPE